MPRYSLKRRPSYIITSPGASSSPASILPSITALPPATIALTMSPLNLMPPSAITDMPCLRAVWAHSNIAEICGMPAPEMTRVVQMEPAPTPTLIASAPALISDSAPSAVTTLPAKTGRSFHALLMRCTASSTPLECPWAVSIVTASTPALTMSSTRVSRSLPTPTAAPTSRRPFESVEALG